jgi:hypothetical protein
MNSPVEFSQRAVSPSTKQLNPKAVICSPSAREGEVEASEYGELAQVNPAIDSPAAGLPRSLS